MEVKLVAGAAAAELVAALQRQTETGEGARQFKVRHVQRRAVLGVVRLDRRAHVVKWGLEQREPVANDNAIHPQIVQDSEIMYCGRLAAAFGDGGVALVRYVRTGA